MKYRIISLCLAFVLLGLCEARAVEKKAPPSGPGAGKMIGAAPIPDLLGKPPPKAKAAAPDEKAPEGALPTSQAVPTPITPGDYVLYLKNGHRDKEWDEWIVPAFESFDSGSYATASIFLSKAYDKGCRDPMVLLRLGIYKESRGEAKEAAKLLRLAAEETPKHYPKHPIATGIHRHAGRALYKVDDFEAALPHLKEALKHEPEDFMLLLMTGQIERMKGNIKAARGYFERALAARMPAGMKPDPKSTVLGELMIITFEQGDLEACDRYVKAALKHDPKDKVALKYKGLVGRARFRQRELEIIKKISE